MVNKKIRATIIVEKLAQICHKQWSGWMKYLFKKSVKNPDGTVTIPKWAVDRWERQSNTEYDNLSEFEKDSDRNEAHQLIWQGMIHRSEILGMVTFNHATTYQCLLDAYNKRQLDESLGDVLSRQAKALAADPNVIEVKEQQCPEA